MKPTNPDGLPGSQEIFAKDQPEYNPLPATVDGDKVWSRWSLTEVERRAILDGACVELAVYTFGQKLQPLYMRIQGVEEVHEDDPNS